MHWSTIEEARLENLTKGVEDKTALMTQASLTVGLPHFTACVTDRLLIVGRR